RRRPPASARPKPLWRFATMPPLPSTIENATVVIPPVTNGRKIWLQVGTLLDGVSDGPLKDAHFVYDAEAIRYVGRSDAPPPANLLNPGQTQPDLNLPEWTLLPGFIEAHAHFFLEGGELDAEKRAAYLRQSPHLLLELAKKR